MAIMGRCMRDKKQVTIQDVKFAITKRCGVRAYGTCPICKGNVSAMIGADKAPENIQKKVAECKKQNKKGGGSRKSRKSARKEDDEPKIAKKSRKSSKRKSRSSRK